MVNLPMCIGIWYNLQAQQIITIFLQQLSWHIFINSRINPPQTLFYKLLLTIWHPYKKKKKKTNKLTSIVKIVWQFLFIFIYVQRKMGKGKLFQLFNQRRPKFTEHWSSPKQTNILGKKRMHSGRFAFTLSVILFFTIFPYIQVPTQLRKYMIQMFL